MIGSPKCRRITYVNAGRINNKNGFENQRGIDKNFLFSKTLKKEGLTYYNAEELEVYGVKRQDEI